MSFIRKRQRRTIWWWSLTEFHEVLISGLFPLVDVCRGVKLTNKVDATTLRYQLSLVRLHRSSTSRFSEREVGLVRLRDVALERVVGGVLSRIHICRFKHGTIMLLDKQNS